MTFAKILDFLLGLKTRFKAPTIDLLIFSVTRFLISGIPQAQHGNENFLTLCDNEFGLADDYSKLIILQTTICPINYHYVNRHILPFIFIFLDLIDFVHVICGIHYDSQSVSDKDDQLTCNDFRYLLGNFCPMIRACRREEPFLKRQLFDDRNIF